MTLSSSNLNEIANLYESIAASEQEVLNEGGPGAGGAAYAQQFAAQQAAKQKAQASVANKAQTGTIQTGTGILGMNRSDTFKRTAQGNLQITNQKGTRDTMDKTIKYGGASYNRLTGKNGNVTYVRSGGSKPAAPGQGSGGAGAPARPAAGGPPTASARPAATPAKVVPSKPAVGGAKPAGSPMQQWAAAHPDLAAKVKPGQSGYGDIQKQRNTASLSAPKAPASSTLGQAVSAASKPSSFSPAPATTSQATSAAPSTSPIASGSVVSASNKVAAMKQQPQVKPIAAGYEYEDAYDLVLEYLFDNGHVDTVEEAHYVMMELDAEVIQDIVEEVLDEAMSSYDRNRQRAAQRAAARNAARAQGKTGAVPGVGYVTPRKESETWTDERGQQRHTSGARMPKKD